MSWLHSALEMAIATEYAKKELRRRESKSPNSTPGGWRAVLWVFGLWI